MELTNQELIEKELKEILDNLKHANNLNEDDPSQVALVQAIQKMRVKMLDVAALAYIAKPGNFALLDVLNSTIGQMEKSVRDDRKERAKAQEKEDNRATFNQLYEAMQCMAKGSLAKATWTDESFFLRPGLSFTEVTDIGKIKDDEIRMGRIGTDLDGNDL